AKSPRSCTAAPLRLSTLRHTSGQPRGGDGAALSVAGKKRGGNGADFAAQRLARQAPAADDYLREMRKTRAALGRAGAAFRQSRDEATGARTGGAIRPCAGHRK